MGIEPTVLSGIGAGIAEVQPVGATPAKSARVGGSAAHFHTAPQRRGRAAHGARIREIGSNHPAAVRKGSVVLQLGSRGQSAGVGDGTRRSIREVTHV